MNVPYKGEFPIKAVFELDQLPLDKTQDGSRWLPALSDAKSYWAKGGHRVDMQVLNGVTYLPYFPTEKAVGEYDQVIKQALGLAGAGTGVINELLNTDIKPIEPNCDFNINARISLPADDLGFAGQLLTYAYARSPLYDSFSQSAKDLIDANNHEPTGITFNFSNVGALPVMADTNYNTINEVSSSSNVGYKLEFIHAGGLPVATYITDNQMTGEYSEEYAPSWGLFLKNAGSFNTSLIFNKTIKMPLIPPIPIPTPPYLKTYEDILFPIPHKGIGCCAIYQFPITVNELTRYTTILPNGSTDIQDTYENKTYYFDLFYTAKIQFSGFNYLIKNNYFAESKLNNYLIRSGTTPPMSDAYLKVVQPLGFGYFKGAFMFGGAGLGIYLETQDGTIISKKYFNAPRYGSDINNNLINFISNLYDLYPMSYDINKDVLINLPKMNMEAISTLDASNELIYLDDTENYSDFNYFGASDGAYTVIAGGMSNGADEIIFLLRNGKGWYNLKLNDLLDEQQTVDYFSYEYGIIYLGINGMNPDDPIKYLAVIPNLPFQRVPLLTYDFKKLGISFIPCQTHCMAKGGIVSKVH